MFMSQDSLMADYCQALRTMVLQFRVSELQLLLGPALVTRRQLSLGL